jgi:ABC-type transport system substrate-binding protein
MAALTSTKVLRVGVLSEMHNLDPLSASDTESGFVLAQILETPFTVRPGTLEIEPQLFAERLQVIAGTGELGREGRLRPEVRFSDGSPVDLDEVLACLRACPMVSGQADVERQGDRFRFHLRRPDARFEFALTHPQSSLCRRVPGGILGSGPFQVAPDSSPRLVRLVRNPHSHAPPALDEILIEAFPSDASGNPTPLVEALARGEIDLCNVVPRDDIAKLSGVRKSILPGASTAMLFLNTESPQLADVRARQVIARSVDRLKIAKLCYTNALAFTATSVLPRGLSVADDELTHDPLWVRSTLGETDIQLPDRLTLLVIWGPRPYLPNPLRVAEELARQLQEIGIRLDIDQAPNSKVFLERLVQGNQDLVLGGWAADTPDPADFLESCLASYRIPTRETLSVSFNNGRLRSPRMDQALAEYRAERTADKLLAVMHLLSEEVPLVPLIYGSAAAVVSYRVKNFVPSPLQVYPLAGLDLTA